MSDPWEVGEAVKWQPLLGVLLQTIDDEHGGRALIKLDESVAYRGADWCYLVATLRHHEVDTAGLQSGMVFEAAFIGISDQQAASTSPMDTGSWRGGLAFTGHMERAC